VPEWIVWRGTSAAKRTLVVTLRKETCRDTMSDEAAFAYRAVVSFADGTAAHGCCRG
jgi:uncharacterized membrane protein